MQTTKLDDVDDQRLAPFRDIRHRKTDATSPHFIVEGRLNVCRLLASRFETRSIVIQAGTDTTQIAAARQAKAIPVYELDRDLIRQLIGFDFHRGVIAAATRPQLRPLDQLKADPQNHSVVVAAIGISEAENLGSLMRSAAGFGIRDFVIGPGTIDAFSRRVVRVSMGTIFGLNLYQAAAPVTDMQAMHAAGWQSIAACLTPGAKPIADWQPIGNQQLLLLGNEAAGLAPDVLQAVASRVTIPMHAGVDSLNVGVAGAVLMYELTRAVHTT